MVVDNKLRLKYIMECMEDLINHSGVNERNINYKRREYRIFISNEGKDKFNVKHLLEICAFVKAFTKNNQRYVKKSVVIDIKEFDSFADKNVFILLDLVILYLINRCPQIDLSIEINLSTSYFVSVGLLNMTMIKYLNIYGDLNCIKRNKFNDLFLKDKQTKVDLKNSTIYTYRRILTKDDWTTQATSITSSEVSSSLELFFDDEDWIDAICRVIEELMDNAKSHNNKLFIFDIHYIDNLVVDNIDKKYKGIDISLINLGDKLLYEQLKENIENQTYDKDDEIYSQIYKAKTNHEKFYGENYNEKDFYIIAAHQSGVSTRYGKDSLNSRSGLTTLLKEIAGKTVSDSEYMITGYNGLWYLENYLNDTNSSKFVGFNESGDFISMPPNEECIFKSNMYIPGTIHQLRLVQNKE